MYQYFQNCDCNSLSEVKQHYKKLVLQFHPDRGGSETIMTAINLEYERLVKQLVKGERIPGEQYTAEQQESEIINAEAYKNAINAVINLEGIEIEVCGGWIWISGNTYPHRAILKANGFYFASKKVMWYFRSAEYKTSSHKTMDIDTIRGKYGSTKIGIKQAQRITA